MPCIICGDGDGSGHFYVIRDITVCLCEKHSRDAENFDYRYQKIKCSYQQTPNPCQ